MVPQWLIRGGKGGVGLSSGWRGLDGGLRR